MHWHSLYNRYDIFLASLPPASPFRQPLPPTPADSQQVNDILKELSTKMELCGERGGCLRLLVCG